MAAAAATGRDTRLEPTAPRLIAGGGRARAGRYDNGVNGIFVPAAMMQAAARARARARARGFEE